MRLNYQEKRLTKAKLEGNSDKEIGALFGLTEGTVRTYFSRIYAKLEVHSWRAASGKIRKIGEKNFFEN